MKLKKIFSSETTEPISTKLCWNDSWVVLFQNCVGMPYCGKRFWDPYMLIFLSKYWWQKSDISSQASYRYPILWEAFFDPSDSYFLFSDLVGFYTHLTYMYIFRLIFLSNYWWQESDIWSQASYIGHIVRSVFGPIRLLLPVCRLGWFLYTLNIYAGVS